MSAPKVDFLKGPTCSPYVVRMAALAKVMFVRVPEEDPKLVHPDLDW